jgi:hypothetical protein
MRTWATPPQLRNVLSLDNAFVDDGERNANGLADPAKPVCSRAISDPSEFKPLGVTCASIAL